MTRKFHPIANMFPLMHGKEFEDLKTDIAQNGLIENIWLHPNGQIIDGRNRYRACEQLEITPSYQTYEGDLSTFALITFVMSLNEKRRHLDKSQLAACAVMATKLMEKLEVEAKERQGQRTDLRLTSVKELTEVKEPERATQQAATLFSTNRQYINDAKNLQKDEPELFEQVRVGELTIPQAKKTQRQKKSIASEKDALSKQSSINWHITDNQNVIKCDAVITDPPYGIIDETWEPDDIERFTREWLTRWNESNADFLVSFWSQEYLFNGRKWFDESLTNYQFQQVLIWHYPNNKSPQSRSKFKQTYEPIFFYRHKESHKPVGVYGSEWGNGLIDFDCLVEAVPQSNFKDVNMKQHPAQKPLKALLWLVSSLTDIGDIICDPFCGSGTTGIAAIKLNRQFHGIEIEKEYIELSNRRIAKYGV